MNKDVLTAAKERIRYIMDEFEDIVVNVSGGKDSEVVFHLVKEIAREKGRLPIKVLWIDQEIERTSTYETVKRQMRDKDVIPYWYQIELGEEVATDTSKRLEMCRDESKKDVRIRPKEKDSIQDNTGLPDSREDGIFEAIFGRDFKDKKTAVFTGVRAEESFRRFLGLTSNATYKRITRGRKNTNNVFSFHPIYDWTFDDVWKYIYDNHLEYNKIYDYYFRYGLNRNRFRVSSLFHETAYHSLEYAQEIDLNLYNKLLKRLNGVVALNQSNDTFQVRVPPFFKNKVEYLNYLVVAMKCDDKMKRDLFGALTSIDNKLIECGLSDEKYSYEMDKALDVAIKEILVNDTCLTKMSNYRATVSSKYKDKYKSFIG